MAWYWTLISAFRNLWANRLRTLLTLMGIVVGVAALIMTIAVGRGARESADAELDSLGRNAVHVHASWIPIEGKAAKRKFFRLTLADLEAIRRLDSIRIASPVLMNREQIVCGSAETSSFLLGVSPEFPEIFRWPIIQGRNFNDFEMREGASVALLAKGVSTNLFGTENPIEKNIRIGRAPFTVIGVLEERAGNGISDDNTVLVPLGAAQMKVKSFPYISSIVAEPKDPGVIDSVCEQIVSLLSDRNNCPPNAKRKPFVAQSSQEWIKATLETSRNFSMLIALTAALSLFVGGIGIMNTTMMSVYERTREIGVRLAVGARSSDILLLFIFESLILSIVGGLLGVAIGVEASILVAKFVQWPPVISLTSIVFAFVCANLVGLVSGLYPAWRASRLEPVQCLQAD
jgi:putative ABC transport system permease protein